MKDRTFHRRFSIITVCALVVFAVIAFFLFMSDFVSESPLYGLLLSLIVVVMTERMLHTTYVFTEKDGEQVLIIHHGRLGRRQTIRLSEVVKVVPMRRLGGVSRFVMLVYGADHMLAVEPEEEKIFCKELLKRMKDYDDETK